MPPRAVLFDLFDTLVPGQPLAAWEQMYAGVAAAVDVDPSAFHEAWHAAYADRMAGVVGDVEAQIESILAQLQQQRDAATIARAAQVKREFMAGVLQPKTDAVATLEALRERGLALGLVTDCSYDTPAILDAHSPLGAFFDVRACSAHLGIRKPHPDMYGHVTTRLSIPAEHCLYVGDGNSNELVGAKQQNMTTVWVDNGDRQAFKERWSPHGDYRVQALAELLPLVDGLMDGAG